MPDRLLLLHWNELSIPADLTAAELQANPQWAQLAQTALSTFQDVLRVRPDCRISFTKGTFHGHVAGRPLQSWLESWLGLDRWRQLRSRAVQPTSRELPPVHALECELSCNGQRGEGITRAHVAESWTLSVASAVTGSAGHYIRAEQTSIAIDAHVEVDVPNLAASDHLGHWVDDLAVWGQQLSNNHVVAVLDRYQIIMYPFDHGYAHIHVRAQDDPRLNAKYRVDKFEPLTNDRPAGMDALIEPWVAQRREQLIQSWNRCQAGAFPLKLES
jgi:hypothetical protein